MRSFLMVCALLGSVVGFARPAAAQCDVEPAAFTYTDGRPHLNQTATRYGTATCSGYTLVDVTYKALSPLPGTYVSWSDVDAATQTLCITSKISAKVWDRTTSPPVYKGEVSSAGVWITNRDPASNPAPAQVCHVAPIRLETSFSLTPGRKYRLAVRAYRSDQKGSTRHFVLANAPLPTVETGCGSLGGGFYCALPASSGASASSDRWPTTSFRLKMEAPDMKVAQGGDLFFQDGNFFQPARTYQQWAAPNFGYSNAALVYKGQVASVDSFTCGDFTMLQDVNASPTYSYLDQVGTSTTASGSGYCVLNARNDAIFRVFVDKSAPNLLVVANRWDRSTNRAAWGCLDGMCDADVRLASVYTRYTTTERDSFVRRQFDLVHKGRACIEAAFQSRMPVPLPVNLHGERMAPTPADAISFGLGGPSLLSVGFQGLWKAGHNRILDSRDIRFELHEETHVFNAHLFAAPLPGWFNEGMAIQTNRLACGGDPDYLHDFWRSWTPGNTDGHAVGSEFFKRLETDYACDVTCTYDLWRTLSANLGTRATLTNADLKAAMEVRLGRTLTPLFDTLGIAY